MSVTRVTQARTGFGERGEGERGEKERGREEGETDEVARISEAKIRQEDSLAAGEARKATF